MKRSFAILKGQGSGVRALELLNINFLFLVKTARVTFSGLAMNNERLRLADMFGNEDMSMTNNTNRTHLENRKIRKLMRIFVPNFPCAGMGMCIDPPDRYLLRA